MIAPDDSGDEWVWTGPEEFDDGPESIADSFTGRWCRDPACAMPHDHLTDECDYSYVDEDYDRLADQRGRWAVDDHGWWTRWHKKSDARRWARAVGGIVRRWRRDRARGRS